jgi:pilus assembly protein Flp/PilA
VPIEILIELRIAFRIFLTRPAMPRAIRLRYEKVLRLKHDQGQNLIEYALVVALIAFAATAGMKTLATKLNTAFSNIASQVSSNIT